MANYLDANPSERGMLEWSRSDPAHQFVPIVRYGQFAALVNARNIAAYAPADPLSVADFVVGLEVMGFRWAVVRGAGKRLEAFLFDPAVSLPPAWSALSAALLYAFDRDERGDELAAFLLARDGAASRRDVEDRIEAAIAALDGLDDDGREDDGTAEPSLGWTRTQAIGTTDDREEDRADVD